MNQRSRRPHRLDHVLVSEAWQMLALEYGPPGGSDHAPLIVDLAWVGNA